MTDTTAVAVAPEARADVTVETFAFGDPEPVMSRREILGHAECWWQGRWFEPPVPTEALTRAYQVGPHHASALQVKVNLLASTFEPSRLLDQQTFKGLALDYLALGNAYPERINNRLGGPLRIGRPLARYVRRGREADAFLQVRGWRDEFAFPRGSVLQLMQPGLDQEIYGLPEYVGALQSAFLNEAATLFRRKYYLNGSHAGFLLYSTDAQLTQDNVDALRQSLRDAKGPGNFRNMFLHAPGGKADGMKLIPIAQVAAADEFLGIKNTTRDDVLAAHRVPPQLLGIVPANAGGFGDVGKATEVFFRLEVEPLQGVFLAINDWLGVEAVRFRPFEPLAKAGAA